MGKQELLDNWLKGRPAIIKKLAKSHPPFKQFVLKGQEDLGIYTPIAYSEDGTITCNKMDWLGFPIQVFGMNPDDLIPAPTKPRKEKQ